MLLIDDSAVMRAVLQRALGACSDIEVVGQAASARRALGILDETDVDVILLDLAMPDMDGLAALPSLVARAGGAPVLVVSSSCGQGGTATASALRLGAADTLAKPSRLDFAGDFAKALAERVRRLAARPKLPPTAKSMFRFEAAPENEDHSESVHPAIVAMAASTGGVRALQQLLEALPERFDAPVLITQHLPQSFIPFFLLQLREATGRPGRIAETGMLPRPGEILVAPGHAHLTLAQTGSVIHVRLDEENAPSGCRPSADPMFASLARLYGSAAAGVVLSGMGRDGAEGAAALAEAGALVFAQDPETSVVWGMPGVVTRRGHASAVLPPKAIAAALDRGSCRKGGLWN